MFVGLTAEDRAPIFVSIANTLRDLGNRDLVELENFLQCQLDVYKPVTQHLIFVMDGALQNIPVAALYDRSRQEYLIDRYPVAVTPGLQILGAKQSVGNHSGILIGGLTAKSALVQNNKRGDILVSKFL